MSEEHILEAIDREIAFYRRRAGQVFFLGLTVEVLILTGREKMVVPAAWPWIRPYLTECCSLPLRRWVSSSGESTKAEYTC
jgi:hypothetical protein